MRVCCLLTHGFRGGEYEVSPLTRHLKSNGIDAFNVLLYGHGENYKDFGKSRRSDWIGSVGEALAELFKSYDRVILIGLSAGGLINTHFANEKAIGVVFINTPYYYWNIRQIGRNLRLDFLKHSKYYLKESLNKPIWTLIEFLRLLDGAKREGFSRVACPAFIVQAKDDDTVHPKSAKHIFDRLSSKDKEIFFSKGGHDILNGPYSEEVCEAVCRFVKGILEKTDII